MTVPPCVVDVYAVRLDCAELNLPRLTELLSADECERAAGFRFARDRRRYTVCRAALRQILACHLRTAPQSLTFTAGPHGKPRLPEGPSFNVAHSHELGLVVVSADAPALGVDLERIRRDRPVAGLIRRFLSPSERQALERLGDAQLVEAFHWCWTAKEAYLKALGVGLSEPLDRFDVSVDLAAPTILLVDRGAPINIPWTLRRLHVADGYAATVALAAQACEVREWRWPRTWEPAALAPGLRM